MINTFALIPPTNAYEPNVEWYLCSKRQECISLSRGGMHIVNEKHKKYYIKQ